MRHHHVPNFTTASIKRKAMLGQFLYHRLERRDEVRGHLVINCGHRQLDGTASKPVSDRVGASS